MNFKDNFFFLRIRQNWNYKFQSDMTTRVNDLFDVATNVDSPVNIFRLSLNAVSQKGKIETKTKHHRQNQDKKMGMKKILLLFPFDLLLLF